jgi:hypothetical protein
VRSALSRRWRLWGCSLFALGLPAPVLAQSASTLITQAIAPDYSRDRNVSVQELPHPDYDPLGIRVGSFIANPAVTVSTGATNNVFTDDRNKKSDVYVVFEPYLRLGSDWSRHQLSFESAGDIRRYANQGLRNQNGWYANGRGQFEVRDYLTVSADGQIARTFESPYSGDVATNVTVLSNYLRKYGALRATYTRGRTRVVASFDRTSFVFNTIDFADGTQRAQAFRDRTMSRGAVLGELGLDPTVSVFGQFSYDGIDYRQALVDSNPNRDSTGVNVIGGINFDVPGSMRGSIGIGYSVRDYKATIYRNAKGLSAQVKVEFFPSPITTVGLTIQRQIQDASLGSSGAFTDNRVVARVDHLLLENLVLAASAEFARQQYAESDRRVDVVRLSTNARFQMTRSLSIGGDIAYGKSSPAGASLGNPFNELRALFSVKFRR